MDAAYDECVLGATAHTAAVQQHFLDEYLARVFHAQGDHGQAVTDEHHVHAGLIGDVRRGEVVRGYHGDGFVALVHCGERLEGDFLAREYRRSAEWRV